MKVLKLLITLTVLSLFGAETLRAATQEEFIPEDKAKHMGVTAAAQTTCTAVGRLISHSKWGSQITCFVAVNSVGVVKELTDPYNGGNRDEKDIYANLIGSGFSFMFMSIVF